VFGGGKLGRELMRAAAQGRSLAAPPHGDIVEEVNAITRLLAGATPARHHARADHVA
jgi:hypothetical protein